MSSAWSVCSALAFALLSAGCPGDEPGVPLFPEDWASTYTEVRDCRSSSDHDLNNIRVVVDDAALGPYMNRDADFPEGAVVLKPEYDFADTDCTGDIVTIAVMVRDTDPDLPEQRLGWQWQRVDPDMHVVSQNDHRCYDCHSMCGVPPDGYLATCTVP